MAVYLDSSRLLVQIYFEKTDPLDLVNFFLDRYFTSPRAVYPFPKKYNFMNSVHYSGNREFMS